MNFLEERILKDGVVKSSNVTALPKKEKRALLDNKS